RPYDRERKARMMRTEEDLRAALVTRERLAPAPEGVVGGIRRRAARRRRARAVGVLATATLAVTAAAVVPVLLLQPGPSAPPRRALPPIGTPPTGRTSRSPSWPVRRPDYP